MINTHKYCKWDMKSWIMGHRQKRTIKLLALQEESRATLGPSALVAATRHIKTHDSLFSVCSVVDWNRDAVVLGIGVSCIL